MMRNRTLLLACVAILCLTLGASAAPKKKLLLVGHPPDGHPATTHEYDDGLRVLTKCLAPVVDVEVTQVRAEGAWKDGPELMERSDAVVLFVSEGAQWLQKDPARLKALQKLAARGGGLAVLHWGMGTKDAGPIADFVALFGACHGGPDRKYKVAELKAELADPKHPVLAGVADFAVRDEFYYKLKVVKPDAVTPLIRVPLDGEKETVAWAWERPDGGRSFGFSGLHFHDNWKLPEYRRLVAQGVLWTLRLPIPKDGLTVEVSEDDLKLKAMK
jgi:type 1 glutamine amidotransferase